MLPLQGAHKNIRPLGNRILVKRLPAPEVTQSGLYILGREYPSLAVVLAVGNGTRTKRGARRPITDIAEGDLVQFNWRDAHLDTREVAPDTFLVDCNVCDTSISDHGLTL